MISGTGIKKAIDRLLPVKMEEKMFEDELSMLETFSATLIDFFEFSYSGHVYENPEDVPQRNKNIHFCTVIFDLDETLIHARDGKYFIRPFARFILEFIKTKLKGVEIILWSAGIRSHVECSLSLLDPSSSIFSYAICRGEWFYEGNESKSNFKNLTRLKGRCRSTTLFFDDNLRVSESNIGNVIIVPKFIPLRQDEDEDFLNIDTTLYFSAQLIASLYIVSKGETKFSLRKHIERHPFVKILRGETFDHYMIDFKNIHKDFDEKVTLWSSGKK